MPKRKRSREGFPYDATPDVHHFPGVPRSSFDLVNMYGTYNIQPTSDTENTFPLIVPGLPKAYRNMKLTNTTWSREPQKAAWRERAMRLSHTSMTSFQRKRNIVPEKSGKF